MPLCLSFEITYLVYTYNGGRQLTAWNVSKVVDAT